MNKSIFFAALAGTLLLQSGAALADICIAKSKSNNFASALGDDSSWAIERTQATRTYDDWVWRGPEFFRCPKQGVNFCTDSYGKSHQVGYEWAVGGSLNFGGIPIVGGALKLVGPTGSYTRINYWTETWNRSISLQPRYASRPIQVVVRRWVGGNFRGMHVNTGRRCSFGKGSNEEGAMYRWDGNRTFGNWSANKQVSRWFGYQTYKY
jgi:hypothetical protein